MSLPIPHHQGFSMLDMTTIPRPQDSREVESLRWNMRWWDGDEWSHQSCQVLASQSKQASSLIQQGFKVSHRASISCTFSNNNVQQRYVHETSRGHRGTHLLPMNDETARGGGRNNGEGKGNMQRRWNEPLPHPHIIDGLVHLQFIHVHVVRSVIPHHCYPPLMIQVPVSMATVFSKWNACLGKCYLKTNLPLPQMTNKEINEIHV